MTWWWATALAAIGSAQPGAEAAQTSDRIFTTYGYVAEWDSEAGDWFQLAGLPIRLQIPKGPERETYWRIVSAAVERGVALNLRFDGTRGRLGSSPLRVAYPLCSIRVGNDAAFGNEERTCPHRQSAAEAPERMLALGMAQLVERPSAARASLSQALNSAPGLPPLARALAFETRGEASEALAVDLGESDPAHDRHWADALADYRQRAALLPDEADPHFAVARALMSLGGYGEALRIYEDIGRYWPEHSFEVAVRIGALHRQQGDYERALRHLDDNAGDDGPGGMKFHYHRGWTLSLLGRDEEAAREIDRGLEGQPDYYSAYLVRSCSRARLGQLDGALADMRRALELMSIPALEASASNRRDIERGRAVIAALERATANQGGPVTDPCVGFLDRWSRPRDRSPLLAAITGP